MKTCLFIFGYPRSGTTLLRATLNSHENITLVNEPEVFFVMRLAGLGINDTLPASERGRFWDALMTRKSYIAHIRQRGDGIREEFISGRQDLTFKQAYELLLPRPREKSIVWGEKSLNNLFFTPDIQKLYPDCLFLHIIRDPRAAVLSLFNKKQTNRNLPVFDQERAKHIDAEEHFAFFAWAAARWADRMKIAHEASTRIDGDAWVNVKFEDFVSDPRKIISNILEKLGLTLQERMLLPASRNDDIATRPDSRGSYAHQKVSQDFDPTRRAPYRHLSKDLLWIIEHQAAPWLEKLGYAPLGNEILLSRRFLLGTKLLRGRGSIMNKVKGEHGLRQLSHHMEAKQWSPAAGPGRP